MSGDLTQRARRAQYREARAFLDRLTVPYLVVPGNHDIPLYDVYRRFFSPMSRYERFISKNMTPFYEDDEMVVCGMNTAHGHTIKDGIVRPDQLATVCKLFALHPKRWKLLVAHHPFVVPRQIAERHLVDGAAEAVPRLVAVKVDLILTGHLHVSYAHAPDAAGYRNEEHSILGVNAGTCCSNRHRGEPNSYNRLEINGDVITIVNRQWNGTQFVDGPEKAYRHGRGTERLIKVAETAPPAMPTKPA
ncbi:MAG: metallophosphoesterase [Deltaproteobacteria bacterium]|nr:metallophosphoesterase [Deltaproteobacteria bacterium]MDQ3295997.1 metallophosphoesterase [Myxococcota bacterium]